MKTISEFIEELKQRGDDRGFITYDEINQLLPDNPIFLDKIDDIFHELKDAGLEILDETMKGGIRKRKRAPKPKKASTKISFYDDPVRMYLKDMGKVSLLTPEDEAHISKRIEDAQTTINKMTRKRITGYGYSTLKYAVIYLSRKITYTKKFTIPDH